MRDATDADLYAMGWAWVKRTSNGGLLAVTVDAEDAAQWMREGGTASVVRLRPPVKDNEGRNTP